MGGFLLFSALHLSSQGVAIFTGGGGWGCLMQHLRFWSAISASGFKIQDYLIIPSETLKHG